MPWRTQSMRSGICVRVDIKKRNRFMIHTQTFGGNVSILKARACRHVLSLDLRFCALDCSIGRVRTAKKCVHTASA
eukprot:6193888-Pleurochrysis_carterae.AAC.1